MIMFIDEHREGLGVEAICKVLDLSRFCSGPSALILSSFPFESHGAFEPEGRVPPPRVVKAVDVLE